MDAAQGFSLALDNLESGKCCPLHEICHDYLTPDQFMECAQNQALCSKADMVKIRMLDEILDRLARLENHALQ